MTDTRTGVFDGRLLIDGRDAGAFEPPAADFLLVGWRYGRTHTRPVETVRDAIRATAFAMDADTWMANGLLSRSGELVIPGERLRKVASRFI